MIVLVDRTEVLPFLTLGIAEGEEQGTGRRVRFAADRRHVRAWGFALLDGETPSIYVDAHQLLPTLTYSEM